MGGKRPHPGRDNPATALVSLSSGKVICTIPMTQKASANFEELLQNLSLHQKEHADVCFVFKPIHFSMHFLIPAYHPNTCRMYLLWTWGSDFICLAFLEHLFYARNWAKVLLRMRSKSLAPGDPGTNSLEEIIKHIYKQLNCDSQITIGYVNYGVKY